MLIEAICLGIIEGLTEFLPVSSTGHLILAGHVLSFNIASAQSFEIFIQLGAILAVLVLYVDRFKALFFFKGATDSSAMTGRAGLMRLGLACLPALFFGALLHGFVKEFLFNPTSVALALILGGCCLILIERVALKPQEKISLDNISMRTCLLIGFFQCFSLWPGISRSGATIVGGMWLGLERKVAAEFSFLIAVPVMIAAVGFDLIKSASSLAASDLPIFAVGFLVAFITAMLAIKLFLSLLSRLTLEPFGWYRIILGMFVLLI